MGSHPLKLFWAVWYDFPYPEKKAEVFAQFDWNTGAENLFRDIEFARVKSAVFRPFPPDLADRVNTHPESTTNAVPMPLPFYVVHLAEGERLITLRRHFHSYNLPHNPHQPIQETAHRIIYLLGWQKTERGQNQKALMFIHENGTVELSSNAELR